MLNPVYIVNDLDSRQVDPVVIQVDRGVVSSVTDTQEVTYEGSHVTLLTDRDFIWVPDLELPLCEGDEVYLDNQSRERWTIQRGWYEVDSNPAIYGWYLMSVPVGKVRSLYLKDLNNLVFATRKTQFTLPTPLPPNVGLHPRVDAVTALTDKSGDVVLSASGANFGADSTLVWELRSSSAHTTISGLGSELALGAVWSYIIEHESVQVRIQIGDYQSPVLPVL